MLRKVHRGCGAKYVDPEPELPDPLRKSDFINLAKSIHYYYLKLQTITYSIQKEYFYKMQGKLALTSSDMEF